jgi:hypothetical protein
MLCSHHTLLLYISTKLTCPKIMINACTCKCIQILWGLSSQIILSEILCNTSGKNLIKFLVLGGRIISTTQPYKVQQVLNAYLWLISERQERYWFLFKNFCETEFVRLGFSWWWCRTFTSCWMLHHVPWHNISGNPNLQNPYVIKNALDIHTFSITSYVQRFHT